MLGEDHEVLGEEREDDAVLGEKGEDHAVLEMRRENHVALAEWGPHGGDTADGAGSLNHRLLLLFPRYGTPDWVGEKEGLFAPVGILKDFSILMKILSHYSKSV